MHPDFFKVVRGNIELYNIYFIGSLIKAKGITILLNAISKIPNVKLSIIGSDGNNIPSFITEIIHKFKLIDKIFWLGRKSSSEIAIEFKKATMLVLPSYMDTSPNVVSEAMCAGVPVIASDVGGIPYMIKHGKTGILVSAGNVDKLKEAIEMLMKNKNLQLQISKNAKKEAILRFSAKKNCDKTITAYNLINSDTNDI